MLLSTYNVVIETCNEKIKNTCSQRIGHLFGAITVASTEKELSIKEEVL